MPRTVGADCERKGLPHSSQKQKCVKQTGPSTVPHCPSKSKLAESQETALMLSLPENAQAPWASPIPPWGLGFISPSVQKGWDK